MPWTNSKTKYLKDLLEIIIGVMQKCWKSKNHWFGDFSFLWETKETAKIKAQITKPQSTEVYGKERRIFLLCFSKIIHKIYTIHNLLFSKK